MRYLHNPDYVEQQASGEFPWPTVLTAVGAGLSLLVIGTWVFGRPRPTPVDSTALTGGSAVPTPISMPVAGCPSGQQRGGPQGVCGTPEQFSGACREQVPGSDGWVSNPTVGVARCSCLAGSTVSGPLGVQRCCPIGQQGAAGGTCQSPASAGLDEDALDLYLR